MNNFKLGVASVTFRNKSVSQVVEIAKNAGVDFFACHQAAGADHGGVAHPGVGRVGQLFQFSLADIVTGTDLLWIFTKKAGSGDGCCDGIRRHCGFAMAAVDF